MADPQRASFYHTLPENSPVGISRLYAGAEFCPWRLPSVVELRRALFWAREHGLAFTLVTPVLIEPERMPLAATLAALLPEFAPNDEVVISDWGALELVRAAAADVTVVLGRVLSGQKRDARILDLDLSAEQREHFRQGSWYAAPAVELLLEQGIHRIELDNLVQGVAPLPAALRGTLHHPFAMVASSRNCPFRRPGSAAPCPQPCGETFTLQATDTPIPLLQGGNTQFLCIERLPDDLAALGIDRVVEHFELPR